MRRARLLLLVAVLAVAAAVCVSNDTPRYAASAAKRAAAVEIFAQIDSLLAETSRLSGLPVRAKVKSAVATKEEIESYIRQRIAETTDAKRAHAEELALKEFGLLPRDYPLQSATLQLLTEQAAAFYDPRRKKIFIADWTPIDVQRPAIVHELTHALQDQHTSLDSFLDDRLSAEAEMARTAVIEGQAVEVMLQYTLAQSGMTLQSVPDIEAEMGEATIAQSNQFPVFAGAPPYLRESLLFPYTAGLGYVRRMQERYGTGWFDTLMKDPPRSTAEILHPGTRAPAGLDELSCPEVGRVPAGYRRAGDGELGELDVRILLKQYCGAEVAERLAPAWRGLRYAVYENAKQSRAFLVHRSRWRDAQSAAQFAEAYAKVLQAKNEKNAQTAVAGDTVTVYEGMPR